MTFSVFRPKLVRNERVISLKTTVHREGSSSSTDADSASPRAQVDSEEKHASALQQPLIRPGSLRVSSSTPKLEDEDPSSKESKKRLTRASKDGYDALEDEDPSSEDEEQQAPLAPTSGKPTKFQIIASTPHGTVVHKASFNGNTAIKAELVDGNFTVESQSSTPVPSRPGTPRNKGSERPQLLTAENQKLITKHLQALPNYGIQDLDGSYQGQSSGPVVKINILDDEDLKELFPTDCQRVSAKCGSGWSFVLLMLSAAPTAIFTFMFGVTAAHYLETGDLNHTKSIGQIYSEGTHVLSSLSWGLALTCGISSLLVNRVANKKFGEECIKKGKHFAGFVGGVFCCKRKCTRMTNTQLYLATASVGSGIVAGILAKDAFNSIPDDYVRNSGNVLSMITGAPTNLASRFVSSEKVASKLNILKSKEEIFLGTILGVLKETANRLEKNKLESAIQKLDQLTQPVQGTLVDISDPTNADEDEAKATTEALHTIFLKFGLIPPTNLEELVKESYENLQRIFNKEAGEHAQLSCKQRTMLILAYALRYFIVGSCGFAGFITFAEKLSAFFGGKALAFAFGCLLSTTTGILYGVSVNDGPGKLKATWATGHCLDKLKSIAYTFINIPASTSIAYVGWTLSRTHTFFPLSSLSFAYPLALLVTVYWLNLGACSSAILDDRKEENQKEALAKQIQLHNADKKVELKAVRDCGKAVKVIESLEQKLQGQERPANSISPELVIMQKLSLFKPKQAAEEVKEGQTSTASLPWYKRLCGSRGE